MLTTYELTIPVLRPGIGVLATLTGKAAAHAASAETGERTILDARLAPDMMNFTGQIQSATDHAKNGAARLAGRDRPTFADDETRFAALQDRLARTIAYLDTLTPTNFEAAEYRRIELDFGRLKTSMQGGAYLASFLLPNFFFHVATAHGILRQQGVAIGKLDYLGPFD